MSNHRGVSNGRQVTTWSDTAVTKLIRERFGADAGTARWSASGYWSDCFRFEYGDANLVVRIGQHGEDFRKDAFAANFTAPDLPIPQVHMLGQADPEHDYAISDFVPGAALEQASNWDQLVDPICNLFEALRKTDINSITGWGHWTSAGEGQTTSWQDFLLHVNQDPPASRVHGWKDAMATSPAAIAAFDRWYNKLVNMSDVDVPRAIVHNDLFNRNVHAAGPAITGVFDWGNSLIGDHLYDLALLVFWQPWLKHVRDQPVIDELRSRWHGTENVTEFEPRMQACLTHIGLQHMAYHSYLDNFDEVALVANRIDQVMDRTWSPSG